MKAFLLGLLLSFLLFSAIFVWLHRLGKFPRHAATSPDPLYLDALASSATLAANPTPGGDDEVLFIARVRDAFHPFTEANTARNFPLAYAETFYFRDAFHHFDDLPTLTDYMVKTARLSPGVTFEFGPLARNGIVFYLPWTMVVPRRDHPEPQKSIGISHLRFNSDGRVIFHQDYWDSADVLVPRVPVANGIIEAVRRRF